MGTKERPEDDKEILFVCESNAGSSQMAQAFAEECGLKASSAGRHPTAVVNPIVVQVMNEKNIDISRRTPRPLTPELVNRARLVIAIGCSLEDAFPQPLRPTMRRITLDWNWKGMKKMRIEDVRKTRDEIERRVAELSNVHAANLLSRQGVDSFR